MPSAFLTGLRGQIKLWACIDDESLCSAPAIGERRFQAYLAPFKNPAEARAALTAAGVTNIVAEDRKRREAR